MSTLLDPALLDAALIDPALLESTLIDPALVDAALNDPASEPAASSPATTPKTAPAAVAVESDELGFDELGLSEPLMRAVADLGYTIPSAIQARAIPALLDGRDITGVAQTGTGKTAAFGLPLLAAIDPKLPKVQALVLTPTRELAMQVADALSTFAAHLPGITVVPIYGGASFVPQLSALKKGAQVVVGTPGRVIDHLERRTLDISKLSFLVLDEADEMLRMGFAEDVDRILESAPAQRQTALFSATMPPAIRAVANKHLVDPVDVAVTRQSSTVTNVHQAYAVVRFPDKVDALTRVLRVSEGDATIVFVRTKEACDQVGTELVARGISAAAINGDVPQKERERIIDRLRTGKLDVLVATDVAARGLDVERVDLVVNFDAPGEPESYVHRIGRTGRAGRSGQALTFFTPREISRLRLIEKTIRVKLEEVDLPSELDVLRHKASRSLVQAAQRSSVAGLAPYRTAVAEFLADGAHTAEELAVALLALAAGDDGSRDLSAPAARTTSTGFDERAERGGNRPDRPRSSSRSAAGPVYRVAVGRNHGVRPAGIVGAITAEGGLAGKDLGRIDIFDSYSLVEIGGSLSNDTVNRIGKAVVSGQQLRIRPYVTDDQTPRRDHTRPRTDRGYSDRPARPSRGAARDDVRAGSRDRDGYQSSYRGQGRRSAN